MNSVKLTVYLTIDSEQEQRMREQGASDKEIENAIKNSITVKDINMRQPVLDIESVIVEKYY
jgi:hypothetical protein